jgi:DNA recombination protein RmuC
VPSALLNALLGAALVAPLVVVIFLVRQGRLTADAARLEAELAAARRATDEQRIALDDAQTRLRDTFASLSKDALKENRSDFLEHAADLLAPVRETLGKVQAQLADVDKAREGSYRAVTSQLTSLARTQEQLHAATEGLTRSLKSPNVRGRWGEIQLRRIVELAGMLAQCDFAEKASVLTEAGARQTPDLLVRLPGDGTIVVDAKVPIDAYLAIASATSDTQRHEFVAAHTRQMREHLRALGGKEYWRQFQPAPEFVVMFLPLEPLLATAFEHDGTLLDQAASLRVIPATPMTLLALLKAVAYGWQQQAITRNAEEIQMLGRDLYDRLATVVEHLEDVGKSIKLAGASYDKLVGSLEQKVLPGARRFRDLGVSSTKDIDDVETLNLNVRRVTKDELTAERRTSNYD